MWSCLIIAPQMDLTDTLGQGDGLASCCLEVSSGTILMEKNRGDRSLTGLCTWTTGGVMEPLASGTLLQEVYQNLRADFEDL